MKLFSWLFKKKKPKSAFDEIHKFLIDNKIPFKFTDGKK